MANNYTETTRSYGKDRIYDWMLNHTTKRNQEHDRKTAFYTLSASSVEHEKKMLPHCNYIESWNTSKKHTNQNHELLCDIENKEDISLTAVRGDINHERGLNPLIEEGSLSTFFYDYCGLHKCIDGFKEACQNQKDLHERGVVTAFYVTFTISGRSKDGSSRMKELSKEFSELMNPTTLNALCQKSLKGSSKSAKIIAVARSLLMELTTAMAQRLS